MSHIIFIADSYDEAVRIVSGNISIIAQDYYELMGKYRASGDYSLLKGIIYDKECIYEMLEWEIYENKP